MLKSTLGRKLTAPTLRGKAQVERKTAGGWIVTNLALRCDVEDRSVGQAPMQADPTGAPTERSLTWLVRFPYGSDVRQRDRLTITHPYVPNLPVMIVSLPWRDQFGDSHDVTAVAEEQAVELEWVAFTRYDQDTDTIGAVGTYPVSVSWDSRDPATSASASANARYMIATLTGPTPLPVEIGDLAGPIHNRHGGQVIDVRPVTAGRRELRVRYDIGDA